MRPLALLLAALCAGLLLGCGDEDGDEGTSRPVTVKAGSGLSVVGNEYSFDPSRVVVAGSRAGPTRLRITLENEGSLAHNLKVFRGDEELGGTPTFQGGRTESGSVSLEPGRYRMVCTVGNHADLGMVGDLGVRQR
jgi:plastocyanin